jgi:hypothetical protein
MFSFFTGEGVLICDVPVVTGAGIPLGLDDMYAPGDALPWR